MAGRVPQPALLPGRAVPRVEMLAGIPIDPAAVPEAEPAAIASTATVASTPIARSAALGARSAHAAATLPTTTIATPAVARLSAQSM